MKDTKSKITKKHVSEYRKWAKLSIFLGKLLSYVEGKKSLIEEEFFEAAKEGGPCITDGLICETKEFAGKKSIAYKAAYSYTYSLLSPAKRKLADAYELTVTKEPVSSTRLVVTDTEISFYANELKHKEVDIKPFLSFVE